MTYNIFDGGEGRMDLITAAVVQESPDVLVINEANNFLANDGKLAKQFSKDTKLPFYEIAPTEWGYDVAVFSKLPFKKTHVLMPNRRAAVSVQIDSPMGLLSIIGAHLNPESEDVRLPEIKTIVDDQKMFENRIIMGDLNALSRMDDYRPEIISRFNEKQMTKFTRNGKSRFEVVDELIKAGYHDAAYPEHNKETTVPTPSNKDIAHTDLRLDYIFLSESLLSHVIDYKVVKNETTDKGSDHYPVLISIK
jgi:exodeoxyribonuclease-3